MREIVFDTETTGVVPVHDDPTVCDRIVEIGCVEIFNLERTGREFHVYLDPERHVSEEVVRVHGLTREFLQVNGKKFADIVEDFIAFVGDAPLVAHNANFDANFLNAELKRLRRSPAPPEKFVDTLLIARKRFPGASNSLDALAKRFQLDRNGFDLSARKGAGGHGALVDARILAEVYLELRGGREQGLNFGGEAAAASETAQTVIFTPRAQRPQPLPSFRTPDEEEAHAAFVATLGPDALWLKQTG